jgi:uncharacterized membrane protein YfcA
MLILSFFLYILVGSLAGIAGGLLGIGGGTIIVPCLVIIYKMIELPQAYIMHLAIGTSLASIVFSTLSAARAHNRRSAVAWDFVKRMLPGTLVGCLLGGFFAQAISGVILEIIFGIFVFCLGLHFLRPIKDAHQESAMPGFPLIDISSSLIACLSSVLGIGGGVLIVPFLNHHKVNEKKAIGTSTALSSFISIFGACFYAAFGIEELGVGINLGYIYLPAFIFLSISSYLSAPYGAKLAHRLPTKLLRKIFACTLIFVGVLMIAK